MKFTIDDKQLITWMWVKKICRKTLAQGVIDRRWSLDGVKHWSKNQGDIFNFVDLCSGVGIVWSTITRTRISDVTSVTFSVKCFNSLKLYPLSGNIFKKWFTLYFFFIYSREFHNNVISNGKSHCCSDTFTDVRFTLLLANNI